MPSIRSANLNDIEEIYQLYKRVATHNPGTLTQESYEITLEYIEEMVRCSLDRGRMFVIESNNRIVAYIKTFTSQFKCLAHVLDNGTLMVCPDCQGVGYGAKIFLYLLKEIRLNMKHILRLEIVPHAANSGAVNMYYKLGFILESDARQKIRNYDGSFDYESRMTWFNPSFCEIELKKYHLYLKEKYFS